MWFFEEVMLNYVPQEIISENDDYSEVSYASKIDWTCQVAGTYYVEVKGTKYYIKKLFIDNAYSMAMAVIR